MKRGLTVLLGMIMVMGLAACGNNEAGENAANVNNTTAEAAAPSEAPAGENGSGANENGEAAEEVLPSVDELITKSAEASQNLQSFAMDMEMSQIISTSQGEDSQEQEIDMTSTAEYTKQPLQMHQVLEAEIPGQGTQKIEQYITEKGIYSFTGGQWIKLPDSMTAQLTATLEQSASPEKQLEHFKSMTDETKVSADGDDYLLTAEVSGENVKELAKNYMNQTGGTNDQMTAMMEQMEITSMTITYGMNKETYLPTTTDVSMVMNMGSEGQKVDLTMSINGTIGQHNEISGIEIPKEALNAPQAELPQAAE